MPDTLFSHFSGYPLSCLLSGFIVIEADVHLLDVWAVLQHLPQNLVRNTAGCRITLAFPAVLEHGDKGQHIDRRFEEIQHVTATMPVEAVLRFAARCIALETALCGGASFVNVPNVSCLVRTHEHRIVVPITLIDQTPVGECIQHLLVDATTL